MLFATVAEERDGIATEPPVDVDAWAERWRLDGTLLAVARAGELVGSLSIEAAAGSASASWAWRSRGTGAGGASASALVAAGIEWARERSLHKLTLSVFPHNAAAIAPLPQVRGFVEEPAWPGASHYSAAGPAGPELWNALCTWGCRSRSPRPRRSAARAGQRQAAASASTASRARAREASPGLDPHRVLRPPPGSADLAVDEQRARPDAGRPEPFALILARHQQLALGCRGAGSTRRRSAAGARARRPSRRHASPARPPRAATRRRAASEPAAASPRATRRRRPPSASRSPPSGRTPRRSRARRRGGSAGRARGARRPARCSGSATAQTSGARAPPQRIASVPVVVAYLSALPMRSAARASRSVIRLPRDARGAAPPSARPAGGPSRPRAAARA